MRRIIYTFFFVLFSAVAFGQTHLYQFKITDSENAEVRKYAQQVFFKVFHVAALYDGATQTFTVKSETEISETAFAEKLTAQGYTLTAFYISASEEVNPIPASKE